MLQSKPLISENMENMNLKIFFFGKIRCEGRDGENDDFLQMSE